MAPGPLRAGLCHGALALAAAAPAKTVARAFATPLMIRERRLPQPERRLAAHPER